MTDIESKKKFINIHNNVIRKSEIACITAPYKNGKKVEMQDRKMVLYEIQIILASGYTITIENYDIKQLNRMTTELLKKISE